MKSEYRNKSQILERNESNYSRYRKDMKSEYKREMKSGENEIRVQHTTVDTEKYEIRIQERKEIRRK